jgi:integrase
MDRSIENVRYLPARLIIPLPGTKDQRCYIKYNAYSVPDGRIKKFRVYQIDNYKDHPKFNEICEELIAQINFKIAHGAIFDPENLGFQKILQPEVAKVRIETEPTIFSALDLAMTTKLNMKLNTLTSYQKAVGKFKAYMKSLNRTKELCKDFKYIEAVNYSVFLMQGLKLSARTHNNHINALKTLWFDMRDMEILTENPWAKVNRPSPGKGRNIAFTPEQQTELMRFMQEKYPSLGFACRFMYYTSCRSVEIAHMKIVDIYQAAPDKIHIDRKWSKNSNMRQVVIHPGLEAELQTMNLSQYPSEYYLFSNRLVPGPKKLRDEEIAARFRERVLTPLGYGKEYTFYSWRHTFAVMGYLGGMTIAELGMQLGHQDPASTTAYLKSLGCFENDSVKTKLPGLEF